MLVSSFGVSIIVSYLPAANLPNWSISWTLGLLVSHLLFFLHCTNLATALTLLTTRGSSSVASSKNWAPAPVATSLPWTFSNFKNNCSTLSAAASKLPNASLHTAMVSPSSLPLSTEFSLTGNLVSSHVESAEQGSEFLMSYNRHFEQQIFELTVKSLMALLFIIY